MTRLLCLDQLDQLARLRDDGLGLTNLTKLFLVGSGAVTGGAMAANLIPAPGDGTAEAVQVNLYEAKTQLSSLVERAAKGEEIVIAKAGKPMARLVPMPAADKAPKPLRTFGQNILGITVHSDDWERDIPLEYFQDEGKENPFGGGNLPVSSK